MRDAWDILKWNVVSCPPNLPNSSENHPFMVVVLCVSYEKEFKLKIVPTRKNGREKMSNESSRNRAFVHALAVRVLNDNLKAKEILGINFATNKRNGRVLRVVEVAKKGKHYTQ